MRTIFFMLIAAGSCFAQTYPRWFLDPVELGCGPVAVGFSLPYYTSESADSVAFVDACENLSRLHYTSLAGGEAYWATEAGVYWMGNDFHEKIDSSYLQEELKRGAKLDSFVTGRMTVLLVGDGGCDIPDSMNSLSECSGTEPTWIENIPQSNTYTYAEGVAPQYFYESSSWESAEKRALFNLARSLNVSVEALQKMNGAGGQEISNAEIAVALRDVQVVHRWRDIDRGLFYVLVRMPSVRSGGGE